MGSPANEIVSGFNVGFVVDVVKVQMLSGVGLAVVACAVVMLFSVGVVLSAVLVWCGFRRLEVLTMSRSMRCWVRRSVRSMSLVRVHVAQPYVTVGVTVPLKSLSLL